MFVTPRLRRTRYRTAASESLEVRCLLSTITVTSSADDTVNDGAVTLREAIQAANEDRSVDGSEAGSGADIIVFGSGVEMVQLTGGELEITSDIAVSGTVAIDAQGTSRIFVVTEAGLSVSLNHLELINGNAETGGAVLVTQNGSTELTLEINDVVMSNNSAVGHGGAFHVEGAESSESTITIEGSTFDGNTSGGLGGAVGLKQVGTASIQDSTFRGNVSRRNGGAVRVSQTDTLSVTGSTFVDNRASTSGGGLFYSGVGVVNINDSSLSGNRAISHGGSIYLTGRGSADPLAVVDGVAISNNRAGKSGGGISGELILRNSVVRSNSAGESGGGVFSSLLNLTNSHVENNTAKEGGGLYVVRDGAGEHEIVDSTIRNNTAIRRGGGASVEGESLTVSGSVISENQVTTESSIAAGAGLRFKGEQLEITRSSISRNRLFANGGHGGGLHFDGMDSSLHIDNSTFSGNTTSTYGGRGSGAYLVPRARTTIEIHNSTFVENRATASADRPAMYFVEPADGGGILVHGGGDEVEFRLESSVVSGNETASGKDDVVLTHNIVTDFANNFIGNNRGTGLVPTGSETPDTNGNFVGSAAAPIDPLLQPLAVYNDGSVPVHGLRIDSPLHDHGSNSLGVLTDNRGAARQIGTAPDIGAFEGVVTAMVETQDVTIAEGHDGQTMAAFLLSLDGEAASDVTVDYETYDGTATTTDSDYVAAADSATLSGTDGSTVSVEVLVNGDTKVELDEWFGLRLSAPGTDDIGVRYGSFVGRGASIVGDDSGQLLENRRLIVRGTAASDNVVLRPDGANVLVSLNGDSTSYSATDIDRVYVDGLGGADLIDAQELQVVTIATGGDGDDTLVGGRRSDTLLGGPGSDTINGQKGKDVLDGGSGADELTGGRGADVISGGNDDDTLLGGVGNDVLLGNAGNDRIAGSKGNDRLFGGSGNDTGLGGSGLDSISGGEDNDRLDGGSGRNRILGGAGDDTVMAGEVASVDGGPGDDLLLGGRGDDSLIGGDGDDTIKAGRGGDLLFGDNGHDILNAGPGPDLLMGGLGNDELIGSSGNDIAIGDNGKDDVKGGRGRDILIGGKGADTLSGGSHDDILLAGTTSLTYVPLIYVRIEWSSSRDYLDRVRNIRDSKNKDDRRDRGNRDYFLRPKSHSKSNVFDDAAIDEVRGGSGTDFFLGHKDATNNDRVFRDAEAGEILNFLQPLS